MRLFSKIVFVCNICFVLSVILRLVEIAKKNSKDFSGAILPQPIEGTLALLGYGAIFLNVIFLLVCIWGLASKKIKQIPKWIVWINLFFLFLQVYYFFFSKI